MDITHPQAGPSPAHARALADPGGNTIVPATGDALHDASMASGARDVEGRRTEWLTDVSSGRGEDASPEAMLALYRNVRQMMDANAFDDLDRQLAVAQPERMSRTAMVALLRYSFPVRSRLNHWAKLREAVREELCTRGVDTEEILRGLIAT